MPLAIEYQRTLGDGTDENFKELRVHGSSSPRGR
jgi:hypothetical protein